MRFQSLATLTLLACSVLTAAAHADTFSFAFTPTGGTTTTRVVDSAKNEGVLPYRATWFSSDIQGYTPSMGTLEIDLYNTSQSILDLFWQDSASNYGYYTGPNMYSVVNGVGTILTGTFSVTKSPRYNTGYDSATLVITDLTKQVAATPEPSSLILLGSGLLSVAGMARRRFLTA